MRKPPKTGMYAAAIGVGIAALCCFTPLLVIIFGTIGLAAFTPYLDYVPFPALGLCIILFWISYKKYKQDCKECSQ